MYMLGPRLRKYREARNLSQKEFAAMIGVSNSRVSNWEQGINRPDVDKLGKICEVLRISPSVLLDVDLPNDCDPDWLEPLGKPVRLPIIGTVKGGYNGIAEEDFDGYYTVYDLYEPDLCRCLRVSGDSMSPMLEPNDLVVVHLQPDVENGELAVVIIDNEEGAVKRVIKEDGIITLVSVNPAYPPRSYAGKNRARVRIWGKVIQSHRDY